MHNSSAKSMAYQYPCLRDLDLRLFQHLQQQRVQIRLEATTHTANLMTPHVEHVNNRI